MLTLTEPETTTEHPTRLDVMELLVFEIDELQDLVARAVSWCNGTGVLNSTTARHFIEEAAEVRRRYASVGRAAR